MDPYMFTDLELLEKLKADDTQAFQVLFEKYWERLYLFAWKRLKSSTDAEDVVQQVFMKIWEHRASKDIRFSLEAYLYKAVSYETITVLKNMAATPQGLETINEQVLPVFNDVLGNMDAKELDTLIEAEVSRLPGRMQQVYRMSRQQDMSVKEIATELNLSEQTVKNQLTVALSRLREPILQTMLLMILKDVTFT